MAKFCTKCGKELMEGQVCDCSMNVVSSVNTTSTNNKIDIKESLMDCVNVFKKIFTKPVEAIKEFVCDNKLVAGIIMIVLAAITSGLYKIATLKNMYSSSSADSFNLNDFSSLLQGALSGNLDAAKPDYLKEFFNAFLNNFVEYAVLALVGYVIVSMLFKGKASWKQMVTAVALSVSVILVGNAINSILVFVDGEFIGYLRGYVSSFASVLSMLILFSSVKEVAEIDNNKLFISIASMSVVATAAIDVVNKLFN